MQKQEICLLNYLADTLSTSPDYYRLVTIKPTPIISLTSTDKYRDRFMTAKINLFAIPEEPADPPAHAVISLLSGMLTPSYPEKSDTYEIRFINASPDLLCLKQVGHEPIQLIHSKSKFPQITSAALHDNLQTYNLEAHNGNHVSDELRQILLGILRT